MMKKEMGKRGNEEMAASQSVSTFPHVLISILLLSAVLRLQGLAWGLPCAAHWFSYHPDESLVLRAASNVNLFAGSLDPGFYNYGSFLIYCVSLVTQVLDAWSPLKSFPNEMARMTLVGRWEVALFGVATVYVVYLMGRRIAGHKAGLLAAAVLAVLPMHVMHSHFVTVDVPAAFWVSVALYNALRWPDGVRAALWCGLAAGIAAGTKYNSGLVLLAGWAVVGCTPTPRRFKSLAVMTGAALIGFLLTTPGVLINTPAFLRDFGYEVQHVRTGHGLVFVNTGPGWWYHLSVNLWQGVGAFLPLAVLVALSATTVWRRRPSTPLEPRCCENADADRALKYPSGGPSANRPSDERTPAFSSSVVRTGGVCAQNASPPHPVTPSAAIVLAFAIPYFAVISAAAVRFQRYDVPLLPLLAVGAGILFARLSGRWLALPAVALLCTLVLAQGAVSTMAHPGGDLLETGQPYRGDPRDAVYAWFVRTVSPGTTIGLTREPWFFSPPFSVANGGPQTSAMYHREEARQRYRIVTLPPDASRFEPSPDFVVISDYEYGDALRLQGVPVPERAAHLRPVPLRPGTPPEAERLTRLWNGLTTDYALVGVWAPRQRAFGLSWPKRTLPPHDSYYPYPTLVVFRRVPARHREVGSARRSHTAGYPRLHPFQKITCSQRY